MVTKQVAGLNGEILTVTNQGRRVLSKLKLYTKIRELGYWPQVKAWLEERDLWDAFVLAQTVDEGNDLFDAGIAEFKTRFSLTDEQIETLLDECTIAETEA